MHEGHRQRMLERLMEGADNLQDHELLEILLYNAVPRKNTNPLAHDLLSAFGSLTGVFRAEVEQLKTVTGVGDETARYLRCIGLLLGRIPFGTEEMPSAYNAHEFAPRITERLAPLREEVLEIYCLDAGRKVKCMRRFTTYATDSVRVPLEKIVSFLSSQHPRGIVAAHNHPDGPCTPSREDDEFTARLQMLCSVSGVQLYEHIIVGKDGYYSYYNAGRIEEIRTTFAVEKLLKGFQ